MTEREEPISRVLNGYKAAALAKDVEAFLSLYDGDVRVFDMWGRWSYEGIEAWRGMVAGWFDSLGNERVAVDFEDVRTISGRDVAVVHAFVTYKGIDEDGAELRAMRNRLTWVLRQSAGGAWKVVHEHTSAPLDFETSKVILQVPVPERVS